MVRLSQSFQIAAMAALVAAWSAVAVAQWDSRDDGPVYQRHAFERHHEFGDRHHGQQPSHYMAPPTSGGWFQRPYPYHLDYYRMRYGGSYAPYFGNLYGPPAIYVAPPYYGGYDGYGGYGYGGYGSPPPYDAPGWQGGPGAWQHAPPEEATIDPDEPTP